MPTRSPTANSSPTSDPIPTTSPTTSCPGVTCGRCTGRSPSATCRSVRQTPQARTATNSSPAAGCGIEATLSNCNGWLRIGPGRRTRQARIVVGSVAIRPSCNAPGRAAPLGLADHPDDPEQDHRTQDRGEQGEPPPARGGVQEEAQQESADERADDPDDDVHQDARTATLD